MIEEQVKIHDKFSVEIKLGFQARREKINEFSVRTWLFLPNSLDITTHNYSKSDFYRDLKSNIRLITPVYALQELSEADSEPGRFLSDAIDNLLKSGRDAKTSFEYHIRMYVSIVRSALRDEMEFIIKTYQQKGEVNSLIDNYIRSTQQAALIYRKLGGKILQNRVDKALAEYFFFGDEYLSNVIEQHTFKLIKGLQEPPGATNERQSEHPVAEAPVNESILSQPSESAAPKSGHDKNETYTSEVQGSDSTEHGEFDSGKEVVKQPDKQSKESKNRAVNQETEDPGNAKKDSISGRLMELILSEIDYRKSKGMLIVEKDSKRRNRDLVFRLSMLKKYAENELFLDIKRQREGVLTEQIWLSIAAGISMVFATAIAFSFQRQFGNLTMPFFVALVISYMLKDRIKELARYFLAHRWGRKFFDIKTEVSLNDHRIGWSKEGMDFLAERKVPEEVIRMRQRSSILEAENRNNSEQIILYRKLVRLRRDILDKVSPYPLAGMNDIIRFNVWNYVQKMDNPEVPLFYPGNDGTPEIIKGEKMYYLNLIMRLRHAEGVKYKRYRIVMNRKGIVEVESFPSDGEKVL